MQPETNEEAYARMLVLLSRSRFRSRFHLGIKERQYIFDKGWDTIRRHAEDFVAKRLAPAVIPNDGRRPPCAAIRYSLPSTRPPAAAAAACTSGIKLRPAQP